MLLDRKKIFLLDGLGAVLSAVCLGLLLPAVQTKIGMPFKVLYTFSLMAGVFAFYSLSCYRFADHDQSKWIKVIVAGNSSYCVLSLWAIIRYSGQLTYLGLSYFIGEKLVVLAIVYLEVRVLKSLAAG